MLRLSLEYIKPGMQLARDILGRDGQVILSAGITITERQIENLYKWEVGSVFIINPVLELPPIDEVIRESVRIKAMNTLVNIFQSTTKSKTFGLIDEHRELVRAVAQEVLLKRTTTIHLAQMNRHQDDLLTHSINVAVITAVTAVALGQRDRDSLYVLTLGALLHDIGKVFVPQDLLTKPQLNEAEAELVNNHTVYGFEFLRRIDGVPLLAAHIAFQHHEKYDGSGFPRKIGKDDIHLFSRIVSVANEFDISVANRGGRKGLDLHVAYEAIAAGANTTFDPAVSKAFLSKIALYPVGTLVWLTTGQIGVVNAVTPLVQHRPQIKIITDEEGAVLDNPIIIDLAGKENLTIFIQGILTDKETVAFLEKNQTIPK